MTRGERLGPYETLDAIGAGGMGEVWKARDTRLDRIVAIKISKDQFSERFEREARAVAALNHPHICQLYDVGPNYLVMEYVEGAPLKGPLPIDHALRVGIQLADALDAAHRKGIVHRDLKPANILLTKSGVKVLDFGLASMERINRAAAHEQSMAPTQTQSFTEQGSIVGTLQYMAPEQLQGEKADCRSDIFSFGCVLYEVLAGKRAFGGANAASIIAAIMTAEPTPLSPALAFPPGALERILWRCLAKDPDERWQSARDLKMELEWIAGTRVETDVAARHSLLAWALAGVLALTSLILAVSLWRTSRPDLGLLQFSVDLGRDAMAGVRTTAVLSPDGTRVVFPSGGSDGQQRLSIRQLSEPKATALAGTEGGEDPFFSPDGQWIGFFQRAANAALGGKIRKISVAGGAPFALCDARAMRGASWGADGKIIAALGTGGGLYRIPDAGGTPTQITMPQVATQRWPQILPGGEAVIFTENTNASNFEIASVAFLSLKTGKWKTVVKGGYFGRYLPTGHLLYIHQNTLFGVRFDAARGEAEGTPVPLLDDLQASAITGGGQFDFSQAGSLVYLSGRSSAESHTKPWLDRDGKIQPLLETPGAYLSPRLSPDGKLLSLAEEAGASYVVSVYDLQRRTITKVPLGAPAEGRPLWTPDGEHFVYSSLQNGVHTIWWSHVDGAGQPQKLLESKEYVEPSSFSPDGRRLAYMAESPANGKDLWTLLLDIRDREHPKPAKPELFLASPEDEWNAAFSPDGRWIAYSCNTTSVFEVYVRPFPADSSASGRQWRISSGGAQGPIWSRDGRALLYETLDGHIMEVAYRAQNGPFIFDQPRPWPGLTVQIFTNRGSFDVSPDGKRLVVFPRPDAGAPGQASTHVTFLLNFFDEVRRRISRGK